MLFSGIKETLTHGINSRTLEAMAVAISLYLKDFKTANSTNFMLALGEYIEEMTMYKSDDLLKELAKQKSGEAWVEGIQDGEDVLLEVSSEELKDIGFYTRPSCLIPLRFRPDLQLCLLDRRG